MSKELHAEICKELNELYIRKNNDYGDSFAKLRSELPDAILVRIYDKYSRLKTLMRGTEQQVNDESIADSLFDLSNYCILELMEIRKDKSKLCTGGLPFKAVKYDDIEYVDPKTGKTTKLSLG